MINLDDMLELTRRMTVSRTCFSRIAGAYMDKEGFEDSSFNIHFLKLNTSDRKKNIEIAKTIPFADTNEQLKEYRFPKEPEQRKKSMWQLLMALNNSGLKGDAMLSIFYEVIGENYSATHDYAIYLFHGVYDIPVKGADKEWLEGSEEVYSFIIGAIAPLKAEYELETPQFGFLYPAFSDRSADPERIDIYNIDPSDENKELMSLILGN